MNHYFQFRCLECGDKWVNPPTLPTKCKECESRDIKLEETTAPLEDKSVKFEVDPSRVFERTTDSRGRLSLPTSSYKNKKLKVVVVEKE